MAKITFADKVKINDNPAPEINKLTAENVNEIKNAVNKNVDDISYLKPYRLHTNLFSVLEPVTIRNKELDNEIAGTRWIITNIDTVAKTITFDNTLPFLTGLNERQSDFDYWGCFVSYFEAVRVEAVNYETNTITYTDAFGTITVGDGVTFFNPFRKGRLSSLSPILDVSGAWASQYVQPSGVWKHSDGSYRMFVNGYNGTVMKIGIATSTDLETWSYLGSNPLFTSGTAPFNKSWMATGGIFSVSNPVKIQDSSNYYYVLFTIKNTSALWESVVCIIDEDANIIQIAENPIVITGHANTHGNQAGSIIYHEGIYKVFIINRAAAQVDWTLYEMDMPTPFTGLVKNVNEVAKGTGVNAWNGSHVDACGALIYEDKLYLFVGGTGFTDSTEIWSSNRQYGIYTKESGTWTDYKSNPVICNPIIGQYIWDAGLTWASDHIGGYFGSMIKDNYLYIFISMNAGTNTYKIGSYKFSLSKS